MLACHIMKQVNNPACIHVPTQVTHFLLIHSVIYLVKKKGVADTLMSLTRKQAFI